MAAAKVIIFGPTGDVASVAARIAQAKGAKVFLAMRDTKKAIQGLSPELETTGGFARVQADLTDAASVSRAVKETGATTAFVYLAWQAGDHMKATFEASKVAGVKFIVFLSSFTIPARLPLDQVKPDNRIPYMHARAEMELKKVFTPDAYVALRPGAFAANTRRWRWGIRDGKIDLDSPQTRYDYISHVDMGKVVGEILANGQRNGQNIVYLYGPKLLTQEEAVKTALTSLGKTFGVVRKAEDDEGQQQKGEGDSIAVCLGSVSAHAYDYHNFQEGVDNVKKYTGQPGESYEDWVTKNKQRFVAEEA